MTYQTISKAEAETAARLLRDVAKVTGVSAADIVGRCREVPIVHARFLAACALMGAGMTLGRAGRALGGRDHGTVLNAQLRLDYLMSSREGRRFRQHGAELAALGWVLKGQRRVVRMDGVEDRDGLEFKRIVLSTQPCVKS